MSEPKNLDCIIIGGGPAGLTAGVYLCRFFRTVVLFNFGKPRAEWIDRCHNLIGYDKGISGTELLQKLRKQTSDLKLDTVIEEASVIGRVGDNFRIKAGRMNISRKRFC